LAASSMAGDLEECIRLFTIERSQRTDRAMAASQFTLRAVKEILPWRNGCTQRA